MFGKKNLTEALKSVSSSVTSSIPFLKNDQYGGPKGELFVELLDPEDGSVLQERHIENVITKDFSVLLARLCKDSLDPNHGVFALAVGTGDSGWDLQNPPAPSDTQRSLYNEIERKDFSQTVFRDSGGSSSSIPTSTVDFTTVFSQSEAVGPIVEMGLIGGDVNNDLTTTNEITPANGPYNSSTDVTGKDMLCNYLTFPVINKPATAELKMSWRISF